MIDEWIAEGLSWRHRSYLGGAMTGGGPSPSAFFGFSVPA
jgi:hypothetical protein